MIQSGLGGNFERHSACGIFIPLPTVAISLPIQQIEINHTGTWIEAARLSANALFPAPLVPIITVRWLRDSNIGPTAKLCHRVHPSRPLQPI